MQLVDLNDSHLLHPDGSVHARFQMPWMALIFPAKRAFAVAIVAQSVGLRGARRSVPRWHSALTPVFYPRFAATTLR